MLFLGWVLLLNLGLGLICRRSLPESIQALANSFKNLKLQKKLQDLMHSIVKGAVEVERKFNCGALPCALREQISRDEGLHTKVACKIYGILQNKLQDLVHNIVRGAVEAERK